MADRYDEYDRNRQRHEERGRGGREEERYYSDTPFGGSRGEEERRGTRTEERGWGPQGGGSRGYGQGYAGGMSSFAGQDWRTSQFGGGMGQGGWAPERRWSREGEGWDRGPEEFGGQPGARSRFGMTPWVGALGRLGIQSGFPIGRFTGVGPRGYRRSDERIAEDINDLLTIAPDIDASTIEVVVIDAVCTLTGEVEDRDQKRGAEDLAESVSGVRDVNNQLRARKGIGQRTGEGPTSDREREGQQQTSGAQGVTSTTGTGTGQTGTGQSGTGQSGTGQSGQQAGTGQQRTEQTTPRR